MVRKGVQNKKFLSGKHTFISLSLLGFLILLSVGPFFTNQALAGKLSKNQITEGHNSMGQGMSRMSFSSFDRELAIELMDKNSDGKCDACGMSVEMCIDSGQMECNMVSDAKIGVLGSQHIHADWKIYLDGKVMDFYDKDHMARMQKGLSVSSFIHVDSGSPEPEKTGDLIHMHATGVPLWIFFESVDLELPENLKIYANGIEVADWKKYVFNDLDKILITNGKGDLSEQLNSITNFAGNH